MQRFRHIHHALVDVCSKTFTTKIGYNLFLFASCLLANAYISWISTQLDGDWLPGTFVKVVGSIFLFSLILIPISGGVFGLFSRKIILLFKAMIIVGAVVLFTHPTKLSDLPWFFIYSSYYIFGLNVLATQHLFANQRPSNVILVITLLALVFVWTLVVVGWESGALAV